jgi:glycosyltransferase involved in cell wall biosynthesis
LSRGLPDFIKTYYEEKLYENYNLEIVGGNLEEVKKLENLVKNLNIANYVTFHGYLQRKSAIDIISECSIGLLINSSENQHSTEYTSPLKYFEYLYGGLNVIASDFPSHRTLPYNKMISFFNLEDKNSLTNALQNLPNINSDKNYLTEITVDKRVKKIIELIN